MKSTPSVNFNKFYKQLLHMQISKAQKDTDDLTFFFALLGSSSVKAARKTLVKLTPGPLKNCCPKFSQKFVCQKTFESFVILTYRFINISQLNNTTLFDTHCVFNITLPLSK